jgi:Flp pilus assembly protein TadD
LAGVIAVLGAGLWLTLFRERKITVDYPLAGSVFPPEFPPPTFVWHDPAGAAKTWTVDVTFTSGAAPLRKVSAGEGMTIGEIDPRAVGPTNELPKLTPEQATAHTWRPDPTTWATIKQHSSGGTANLVFTGYRDASLGSPVSRGQVAIRTSTDPVSAPVFYRDVPLMPAETEKGVIKPLAPAAVPLIAWRVRDLARTESRVVMTGVYSCSNCHSASADGKMMGMDIDGPRNDKGLYALFPIQPEAAIRNEDVIAWSTFKGKLGGKLRVGFMSQVSPKGEYVVTTIMDPGKGQKDWERQENPQDLIQNYYVANFKDYRFLQVFYPTRGIIAWYSSQTGMLKSLPGADDPRYVHTNAVWSPDGKYLVFARAQARDAYADGKPMADHANDPNETQIQYDLYRIPFNGGLGGKPEAIQGASANGMSNSFPKVSPDGRWIVFVQARNGQLMRPDSKLYIVPFGGGKARLMNCNTPLMNSWHSFSPNGRWMVFSSKSRSPFTQMMLTHIDENGNDTPAVLVENSTASNRAVNIPEFLNIPADGLTHIDNTFAEYYRLINKASDAMRAGKFAEAAEGYRQAVQIQGNDPVVLNSLGSALGQTGKHAEAIAYLRKAEVLAPDYPSVHSNLGAELAATGKGREAAAEIQKALDLKPDLAEAHTTLGGLLAGQGRYREALPHLLKAVESQPGNPVAQRNLALALADMGKPAEAIPHEEQAIKIGGPDPVMFNFLGQLYARAGRLAEAASVFRQALQMATQGGDRQLVRDLQSQLAALGAQ